jgi:hypothetical protein
VSFQTPSVDGVVTGVSVNVWNAKGGFLERVIYSSPFKGGGRRKAKLLEGGLMGDVSIILFSNIPEELNVVVPEPHRIQSLQPLWGIVKDSRQLHVRMCLVTVGVWFC